MARSWRVWVVVVAAVVAASWLGVVVATDVNQPPDADCLAVDPTVLDLIAAAPIGNPIEPLRAVAVHDPWNRSAGSIPYDNYYAIAMEFRTTDGSIRSGVWGLGTGPAPTEGSPITADGDVILGAPLVNVDQAARDATVWPDDRMFFPEDANAVTDATRCLDLA